MFKHLCGDITSVAANPITDSSENTFFSEKDKEVFSTLGMEIGKLDYPSQKIISRL